MPIGVCRDMFLVMKDHCDFGWTDGFIKSGMALLIQNNGLDKDGIT